MKKRWFLLMIAIILPITGFSAFLDFSCNPGGRTTDINNKNEKFMDQKTIYFKLSPGGSDTKEVPVVNYGMMKIKVEHKIIGPSRVSVYFTGQGVKDFLWSSKDFKWDVSKYYGVSQHWEQKTAPSEVNFLYNLSLSCVPKR